MGYFFGVESCHCCCPDDCCVTIQGYSLCGEGENGGETWVLVSGSGKFTEEGEGYYTLDTGTEQYRFDIRWFPDGTCGRIRFVAKSRIDETGGAFRELEWGTYGLNPDDEGFVYGSGSVGQCPTELAADDEPTVDESSPGPELPPLGLEAYGYSCDCSLMDTCWIFEWELEFLSVMDWPAVVWNATSGSQTLWVDVSDQAGGNRRTCNNGVAVDEVSPGPPGWEVFFPGTVFEPAGLNPGGWIEAGNCSEGYFFFIKSEFETIPGGHQVFGNGPTAIEFREDLTGIGGAVDEVVVRGTMTITRVSPAKKGDCVCP